MFNIYPSSLAPHVTASHLEASELRHLHQIPSLWRKSKVGGGSGGMLASPDEGWWGRGCGQSVPWGNQLGVVWLAGGGHETELRAPGMVSPCPLTPPFLLLSHARTCHLALLLMQLPKASYVSNLSLSHAFVFLGKFYSHSSKPALL